MNDNRAFGLIPRRVMNGAVIVGGLLGIVLQAQFRWSILTTFLVTLGLCMLCVGIVALIYYPRRQR